VGGEGSHAATARIRRDWELMSLGWRRRRELSGDVSLNIWYAHH
jgi:hypothetical protein